MKKSAIPLAVAAALGASAVAQADTILYGSARVSVDWQNPDIDNRFATFFGLGANKDFWEVVNNSSRLGVRGSEDLGNGLSAIYQYEFGIDVTGNTNYFNSNRPRWVGLKGNFGAVTLGTQWTPYYNVIGLLDQFNSSKAFDFYYNRGVTSTGAGSPTGGGVPVFFKRGIAEYRRGNSFVYTTPDFNGFSGQVMLVMDGRLGARAIDTYDVNVKYEKGPLFVGATYVESERPLETFRLPDGSSVGRDDKMYGAAVGWKPEPWGILFSWQRYDPDETFDPFFQGAATAANFRSGQNDVDTFAVGGYFAFGNNVVRGTVAYTRVDDFDADAWTGQLGFQHNLSKRTRLWAEYLYFRQELDEGDTFDNVNVSIDDSQQHTVSVGVRHDF